MPETAVPVYILVSQVNAAGYSHTPVNYRDFTVVPVVLQGREYRSEGIKYGTLNAVFFKLAYEISRNTEKTAYVIVNHSHVNTLCRFLPPESGRT